MFRLLPFLIIFLFAMAFSKMMSVFENAPQIFAISELNAQSLEEKKPGPQEKSDVKEGSESIKESDNNNQTGPEDNSTGANGRQEMTQPQFSAVEVEILESLAKRRDELSQREKEISLKENILKVTEKRINDKISILQSLMAEAKEVLNQYNEKQNQEILALVKIYENMKPKDAARIFDGLQMPILVEVSSKMKEAKLAAILGLMSAEQAKDLTIELANRRKINLNQYNQ